MQMTPFPLNQAQEEAVKHLDGPMLVIAGAGSGKTRVVTQRIAHLLDVGVPASEILALTFTNKAAGEMKTRIASATNSHVLCATFHSLCARILRESIHHFGYESHFSIYDTQDCKTLLKDCLALLGIKEKSYVKEAANAISNAKNDLISPENVQEDYTSKLQGSLKSIYTLYQSKLKEYNALDFDDLLFLCVKLFQTNEEVLKIYQSRWNFILIDEYQDTNEAQYTLTKLLSASHKNVFAVGDPDQSIYSWRGANIQNILNFEKDYPSAKVIPLEQNYRSTKTILQAASALIDHNESRYEKKLWSDLEQGDPIGFYLARSETEEAEFVTKKIEHYSKDISLDECVIFYRTNSQSRIFEDALMRKNIPYKIIGGISFYERKEIKDVLAFLRLSLSKTDFLSFARIVNIPKRGIGKTTLANMATAASKHQIPILTLCEKLIHGEITDIKLSKKQKEGLDNFLFLLNEIEHLYKKNASVHEIIETTIEKSQILDVLKLDNETFEDRKSNLDALIAKGVEWGDDNPAGTLVSFLEELSLQSKAEENNEYVEKVKLMTLHNGKGLEFTLSFIVGLEEDLLPHINSKDSIDQLEEERRLCYVGMTRAKKHLFLSASTYRLIWGIPKVMTPSRFISEIPEEYLEYLHVKKSYHDEYTDDFDDENEFEVGTTVYHKDFGKGSIKKIYKTSLGLTFDVYFYDLDQIKSLVERFAKLTIL